MFCALFARIAPVSFAYPLLRTFGGYESKKDASFALIGI
jgi:hypothetical protein